MGVDTTVLSCEDALIGSLMLDPKVYDEAGLQPEQFLNVAHGAAWKAAGELLSEGVTPDPVTVANKCQSVKVSDLSALMLESPGGNNTVYYATQVRDAWVTRQVSVINSDFDRWSKSGVSGAEMLTRLRKRIESLESATGRSLPTLGEVVESEKRIVKRGRPHGLPSGLGLERVVPGGIPPDKVSTLFGESGNFKTTTKNNIVWSLARAGHRVLDVSLEDSDELTAQRFIANELGISYGAIASDSLSEVDRGAINEFVPGRAAGNVIMAGDIPPNIDEVIRQARFLKRTQSLRAVVLDYVQLLDGGTDRDGLNEIVRKMQLSAKRDSLAYIVVSQVKQEVDFRDDHRPRVTDMLGGSALRTGAKLSVGVYRPSLYEPEVRSKSNRYYNLFTNVPDGDKIYSNIIELHIMKNVVGEANCVLHAIVDKPTGRMLPFDIKPYL